MKFPIRYAAPIATLALAALIVGCPNPNNPPVTNPTPVPQDKISGAKPVGSPKTDGTPSPVPTIGGNGNKATPTPGQATLPPGGGTPGPTGTGTPGPTGTGTPGPTGTATPTATPQVPSMTPTPAPAGAEYMQIERLGRPAINEGLIRANALLNTWNMVSPDVDADPVAAKPLLDEATVTLKALGNTDQQVGTLVTQLLPDVMRIDTEKISGYATSYKNVNPLALDNLSPTKKIPVGGRMLEDDVCDVTLILIVPGGLPGAAAIPGLESDGVSYSANHKPIMSDFPYLAEPN